MNHRHDATDAGPGAFLFCLFLFLLFTAITIALAT